MFSEKGWTGGEGKDTDKVILIVGSDMVIRYRLGKNSDLVDMQDCFTNVELSQLFLHK